MQRVSLVFIVLALALAPAVVRANEQPASDAGTFVATGAPSEYRFMHAAAPLQDGRVMVTGGWYNPTDLVEVWDPATGEFAPAGSLIEIRARHSMTTLDDGRVLVVGGPGGPGSDRFTAMAEVWDPVTETSEPAGSLPEGRAMHSATLLADGRVLVIGGTDGDRGIASAQAWDPATGLFEPAGTLGQARVSHTATLLANGCVLVAGGFAWDGPALASAEVWDPGTASFSPTGPLLRARQDHTATGLDDGRVLIAGGRPDAAVAELWDPATGSSEQAGMLQEARLIHTATLLPDGRVLVIGGLGPEETGESMLATAEIWDPATMSFGPAGAMSGGTFGHTATLLPDGRVLVVGSLMVDEEALSMAQVWEPAER